MFSFVDLRLALLLSAAVLLVRAQGEDDRKSLYCLLDLPDSFYFLFFLLFVHFPPQFLVFLFGWVLKADLLSPWVDSGRDLSKETRTKKNLMCATLLSLERKTNK